MIAALESPGVEVSYQTTFAADGDGKSVWAHFAKDGNLANSDLSWVSDGEKLAGAIAVRFTLQPGEKKVIPMVIAWDFPVVEFGEGRQWNLLYGFLWGQWQQCLGNCARRTSQCDRLERCNRRLAGSVCERSEQAAVVSRHAFQ